MTRRALSCPHPARFWTASGPDLRWSNLLLLRSASSMCHAGLRRHAVDGGKGQGIGCPADE